MLQEFVSSLLGVLVYQAIGVALFLPLELLLPTSRISVKDRAAGFIFLLAAAPAAAVCSVALTALKSGLGIVPLIHLHNGLGAPIMASLSYAIWADLQFYLVHRFEHRFLWRFHAVHHSIRNLSAANSYHHIFEPVWAIFVLGLPLAFVDVQIAPALGFLSALFHFWQFYIHSSSRVSLGPLRWLLVDNRYHRIHHSTDPKHHGKNFAAFFAPFDWIGRTQYVPEENEWPDVGLDELPAPKGLKAWLLAPWSMRQSGLAA